MAKLTKVTGRGLALREPAERIWLAGLGAFAMAEEEGSKLFATLVKKGRVLQKTNTARLDARMEGVREGVMERIDTLREIPDAAMERINGRVDATMTSVLHRFGVPTKREIGTLTRRVEELTRTLEEKKPRTRRPRTARQRRTAAGRKSVVTA